MFIGTIKSRHDLFEKLEYLYRPVRSQIPHLYQQKVFTEGFTTIRHSEIHVNI